MQGDGVCNRQFHEEKIRAGNEELSRRSEVDANNLLITWPVSRCPITWFVRMFVHVRVQARVRVSLCTRACGRVRVNVRPRDRYRARIRVRVCAMHAYVYMYVCVRGYV